MNVEQWCTTFHVRGHITQPIVLLCTSSGMLRNHLHRIVRNIRANNIPEERQFPTWVSFPCKASWLYPLKHCMLISFCLVASALTFHGLCLIKMCLLFRQFQLGSKFLPFLVLSQQQLCLICSFCLSSRYVGHVCMPCHTATVAFSLLVAQHRHS